MTCCTLTWLIRSCIPLHVSGPAGGGWEGRSCCSFPVCSASLTGSSSGVSHPGTPTSDFVCHAVVLSVGARVCDPFSNKSSVWKDSIHICSVCCHACLHYFTNKLQTMEKNRFVFQIKYKNGTPSRKQTCEKFDFTHIFFSATINMRCSVYCDFKCHL